ncbi:MAG: repressor LexA [Planctomycetes bacterium]|nr:repressor LexA [Planctomycetota bacterium]
MFEFVRQALERGEPPTVRDVRDALGLKAVESAREHLNRLVAEGRLVQEPGVARGYRLPPGVAPRSRSVPLLGRVAAGGFSEAIEDLEGHVVVEESPFAKPRAFASRASLARVPNARARSALAPNASAPAAGELFALRVRGESMIGLGIFDGDIVIVRRDAAVRNGDVVVARVDGEATVKSFFRSPERIELRPANPEFATLVVTAERELVLLGKVIEVRRYLDGGRRA